MGMPISSYTVLKTLASGDERSVEMKIIRKALEQFKVNAFFIHDPAAHPEFHQTISERFYQFHSMTGPNLLFFALVNPPDIWKRRDAGKEYARHLLSWEAKELVDPENTPHSGDEGLTAYSLARLLNIPTEMLPVMVVTSHFNEPTFKWFRTCKDHVDQQFAKLVAIANSFDAEVEDRSQTAERSEHGNELRQRILFDMMDDFQLDLCQGSGAAQLTVSLAKALSELLSFITAADERQQYGRREALDHMKRTLINLQLQITGLKQYAQGQSEFSEDDFAVLENLYMDIAGFLAHLQRSSDPGYPVALHQLEQDSQSILKIGCKVQSFLNSEDSGDFKGLVDYTPGLICLAKVFEKEINLSMVHWLRQKYNIRIPEFYNKHEPKKQALIIPNIPGGQPIDLNRRKAKQEWHPPGIGQSLLLARNNIPADAIPLGWTPQSWRLLLDQWGLIAKLRNKGAHTEIVGVSDSQLLVDALRHLEEQQIFNQLFILKRLLRGA